MKSIAIYLIAFLLLLTPTLNWAWRSYVIELTSFQHEDNYDYVQYNDVQLIEHKGHNVLNGTFILKRNIYKPMVYFDVIVPRPVADWTLMNITLDGCRFIEGTSDVGLNLPCMILGEFGKSKYFPTKCPVSKENVIYVDDLYMDAEKFPSYVPDMKFKSSLVFYENKEQFLKAVLTGTVESKRAARVGRRKKVQKN